MPSSITDMFENQRVRDILMSNLNVPFVDRIINKQNYPYITENGQQVTHKMAWGEAGGRYIVYPTVFYNKKANTLENLGSSAYGRALTDRDFIEFSTPEEANWFSKNYKRFWNEQD